MVWLTRMRMQYWKNWMNCLRYDHFHFYASLRIILLFLCLRIEFYFYFPFILKSVTDKLPEVPKEDLPINLPEPPTKEPAGISFLFFYMSNKYLNPWRHWVVYRAGKHKLNIFLATVINLHHTVGCQDVVGQPLTNTLPYSMGLAHVHAYFLWFWECIRESVFYKDDFSYLRTRKAERKERDKRSRNGSSIITTNTLQELVLLWFPIHIHVHVSLHVYCVHIGYISSCNSSIE